MASTKIPDPDWISPQPGPGRCGALKTHRDRLPDICRCIGRFELLLPAKSTRHINDLTQDRGGILHLGKFDLSAPKITGLEELIRSCGAHLIYLPPHPADFHPIELAWSKVKTILRRLKAGTFPDLIEALQQALLAITPYDIHAWFAHCGYAIN